MYKQQFFLKARYARSATRRALRADATRSATVRKNSGNYRCVEGYDMGVWCPRSRRRLIPGASAPPPVMPEFPP